MTADLGTNHQNIENITITGFACDIDETLSITSLSFFKAMQDQFGNPENLSSQEMITKYRFLEHVPYWNTTEHISWMNEAFSNPEMYAHLKEKPGAVQELLEITKTKPLAAYITARTVQLHEVSLQWLKQLGFPHAPILMRDNDKMQYARDEWKAGILKHLYPQITGIIDDDPTLPEKLDPDYKGFIIMFGHDSPIKTNFEIHSAKNWKEVKKIMLNE